MSERDQMKAIALLKVAMEALGDPRKTAEERAALARQIDQFLNHGRPSKGARG